MIVTIPTTYTSLEETKVLLTVDKNDGNPPTFTQPYLIDMSSGQRLTATSAGTYYSFYILPSNVTSVRVDGPTPGLTCSLRAFVNSDSTVLLSYTDNSAIDIGNAVRSQGGLAKKL
ncbi:hypothetical protein COOONC_21376 [Cooperia oncophora]